MKALVYHGKYDVQLDEKPKPEIKDPEDIIVKVTTTAICGSDLHLYHGMVPELEPGQTLGHEFMGVVDEAGRIDPTKLISHVMKLEDAPKAYEMFNRKDATKIILKANSMN